jgi:hypothetical protein
LARLSSQPLEAEALKEFLNRSGKIVSMLAGIE